MLIAWRSALLVFGPLAFAPSKKCCCCLLTKFGLAQCTTTLRFLEKRSDRGHIASAVLYTLPLHAVTAAYSGPINTTGHDASPVTHERELPNAMPWPRKLKVHIDQRRDLRPEMFCWDVFWTLCSRCCDDTNRRAF